MFNLAPVPVPDLAGRTVLVTGAGKGIGAELVRLLAGAGARVYAGVFAARTGRAAPDGVTALSLDVTSRQMSTPPWPGSPPRPAGWTCW